MARSGWRKGFRRLGLWIMPASSAHSARSSWLHILAEVGLRCFAEAVDRKTAALPEGDLVGIHLEDLLLGEAVLELEGDDDLDELALDRCAPA